MESSGALAVLEFRGDVLDSMKREENQVDMIFFTTTIGFGLQYTAATAVVTN